MKLIAALWRADPTLLIETEPTRGLEEAHVEAIAFTYEVEAGVSLIVDQISGLPTPSLSAIEAAFRLAHRARLARAELIALGPTDGTAA